MMRRPFLRPWHGVKNQLIEFANDTAKEILSGF